MQGFFSEEALEQCESLLQATYDYTRCVRPDGSAYGTAGKCRKGAEAGKKPETPGSIAKEFKKNYPSRVKTKVNKSDGSSKIIVATVGDVSSSNVVDKYLQSRGREFNYKHDKQESFVDKSGNKHTITPVTRNGTIVGHTIDIIPPRQR